MSVARHQALLHLAPRLVQAAPSPWVTPLDLYFSLGSLQPLRRRRPKLVLEPPNLRTRAGSTQLLRRCRPRRVRSPLNWMLSIFPMLHLCRLTLLSTPKAPEVGQRCRACTSATAVLAAGPAPDPMCVLLASDSSLFLTFRNAPCAQLRARSTGRIGGVDLVWQV